MYILLLDEGASMMYEWNALLNAAMQFALLVNIPGLKEVSTIAIIKHANNSTIVGEKYKPREAIDIL